jgi:hypothetical protein
MKQQIGFLISIDDGYVEYQFKFAISGDESIWSIAEKIKETFGVQMTCEKRREGEGKR